MVDLRGRGFKREGESKERNREMGDWRGGRVKKGLDKRGDQRGVGNQSLKEEGREGNWISFILRSTSW